MDALSTWLNSRDLGKYYEAFAEAEIVLDDLSELNDDDLRELGLPMGPRRRFLKAVRESNDYKDQGDSLARSEARPDSTDGDSSQPAEAERRQLTVMFADLVGSTELAQRMDPEDLRDINLRYQGAAKATIESVGGFVARYMGDGILAYFGFPVVHEDDPERAVRAGLALIDALDTPDIDIKLSVRVGIATGPVVVGDLIGEGGSRENAVVGETPNLAARLQGLASPGDVIVAEVTQRLVGGVFQFEALPTQSVKGFTDPVTPFRVGDEVFGRSRFDARTGARLSPFTGREEEIALLFRRWRHAETGEGEVVLLVGEPGIGKSRITDQVRLEALGRGGQFLLFQCSSYNRNSSFFPLLNQLESILLSRVGGGDLSYELMRDYFAGAHHANIDEDVSLIANALGVDSIEDPPELMLLDADARRLRTMFALVKFIEHFGGSEPLLCVFEDLHWADPSTVELLSHLIDRLARHPILLIATTRPGFNASWGDRSHCRVVSLSRLDDSHASTLASVVANLSPEAVEQVLDRAGGNPLYIEELSQAWMNVDTQMVGGLEQVVPATLLDSLMARLDATGTGRAVAQCASTLGREFSQTMLSAIWDRDAELLESGLTAAVESGLIYVGSNAQGERKYIFKHALIRDAAYASMLRERRRTLHQKTADYLIELNEGGRRAAPYELIAHHLSEAFNLRAALDHWILAGEAAARTSSYRECEAHLRRGLSLIEETDDAVTHEADELELLVVLGPALMAQYGYSAPSVGEVYERARQLSESMVDRPHLTPILNGLRLHLQCRHGGIRGFEPARALLAHAELLDDDASRIEGRKAIGGIHLWSAQFDEAREQLRGAIALYEKGENMDEMRVDSDSGLTCHSFVSLVEWASGFADRSRRASEVAIVIANRSRRTFGLGEALSFRSLLLFLLRDNANAETIALQARQLAVRHNYVLWEAMSCMVLGSVRIARGDIPAGLNDLQNAGRILTEMEYKLWLPFYLTEIGHAHGCAGALDIAFERFDEALAMVARTDEYFWAPEIHRRKAFWLLRTDNPDAAEKAWIQAIDTASQHDHRASGLRAATDLAQHWISIGRTSDAHELLHPIHTAFEEGFDTADYVDARSALDSASSTT